MHVRPTTSTAPFFRLSCNLSGLPDFRQLIPWKDASISLVTATETVTDLGDAWSRFCELLGIPTGTQDAIAAMSPLQKKGLLFRTFLAQLEGLAARGAVLIVLEDAHWLDPTSRELFDQIVDRLQRLRCS
jgi:hypothetical protein